ncbi:MAG: hypothetical protein WC459_04165 [Patescibacteria group bacterium]
MLQPALYEIKAIPYPGNLPNILKEAEEEPDEEVEAVVETDILEEEIELFDEDLEILPEPQEGPRQRVILRPEYVFSISNTGLLGIHQADESPDWPICSLAIIEDCLAGDFDLDLPDGYAYYQTELRKGVYVLHFMHILKQKSIFIPKHLILRVESLSKNIIIWKA